MRSLASIQMVTNVQPVENSGNLDVLQILGWKVVARRDEFKRGDSVVYVEIDSILPDRPEFEFMKSRGFRVKTARIRGQISQGIAFPLSILPCGEIYEGRNVTDVLGITKYEPQTPAQLAGLSRGGFPDFIPKTDETRVQLLQWLLDKYKGKRFQATEKLDGASVTFYHQQGDFGVCSRNINLTEGDNTYWRMAREYNIKEKIKNLALQGEVIGEGIQGNKYGIKGQKVRFFNAYDLEKGSYFTTKDTERLLSDIGLPQVPVIGHIDLIDDIEKLVDMAKGTSVLAPCKREGIVLRPLEYLTESRYMTGNRVSFKVINPEFLLKYGG